MLGRCFLLSWLCMHQSICSGQSSSVCYATLTAVISGQFLLVILQMFSLLNWLLWTVHVGNLAFRGHNLDDVKMSNCGFLPCGRVMQAPSTIACASSRSLHSTARAAALRASQISFRPSKAGAVSQNSSLLLLSCPSVIGYSLFHLGRSFLRGSLRAMENKQGQSKWGSFQAMCLKKKTTVILSNY